MTENYNSIRRDTTSVTTDNITLGYTEGLQEILVGKFRSPESVISPSEEFVNVGMIMINLGSNTTELPRKFCSDVSKMFVSLFVHSSGTPLNLVIVTDKPSLRSVSLFLGQLLMYQTVRRILIRQSWRWRRRKGLPMIKVQYVDSEMIIKKNREFVNSLKGSTAQSSDHKSVLEDRYSADLFYMAPIYHLAFTGMNKLVMLDCTDLEFHADISDLSQQFRHFTTQHLIGIGLDLSPNYYHQLESYRKHHPDSKFGLAGKTQGFNTGVVLYNLKAMRQSTLYNSYLLPSMVNKVVKQFMYKFTLAEQDWFTNLGYIHPHMFFILPCKFNRQTSIQFLKPPWEEIFESFHSCKPKALVSIYHTNGCGPTPQSCHFDPNQSQGSLYWAGRNIYMEDIHIDVEKLWQPLGRNKNNHV